MELKDLVGEHILDAADFSTEQVKTWGEPFEACQVMRFRLDGKVYTATEDPDDGYRSAMKEITVGDLPMTNVFPPVRVVGRHRPFSEYGRSSDILELIDVGTGNTVIEVGTSGCHSYDPSFVANFRPESMTPNAGVTGLAVNVRGVCGTCLYRDKTGHCQNEKLSEEDLGQTETEKVDMLIYDYNESGGFWVGERFGCIHHTPTRRGMKNEQLR